MLPLCLGERAFFTNFKEFVMNKDRIEGNWEQFKGKVKQTWG